jgi:flagellar motor switch protein FliN/FliY
MIAESLPELSPVDQEYAQKWADGTSSVLGSVKGTAFTAKPLSADAPEVAASPVEDDLWVHFKVSGRLQGDQSFQLTSSDGARLAQMLRGEPLDPTVKFGTKDTDALIELLRMVAGMVATDCKIRYGGEVQFELDTMTNLAGPPAGSASWTFTTPQVDPIIWTIYLSRELHAALESASQPQHDQAPAAAASAREENSRTAVAPRGGGAAVGSVAGGAESSHGEPAHTNLELLLDVQLEASLRFGQKEMLVRDILALRPGSVVELDRKVQEPAELLVAGRVIARGDVVVVDGSYGLRITDIAQPNQRLAAVET